MNLMPETVLLQTNRRIYYHMILTQSHVDCQWGDQILEPVLEPEDVLEDVNCQCHDSWGRCLGCRAGGERKLEWVRW